MIVQHETVAVETIKNDFAITPDVLPESAQHVDESDELISQDWRVERTLLFVRALVIVEFVVHLTVMGDHVVGGALALSVASVAVLIGLNLGIFLFGSRETSSEQIRRLGLISYLVGSSAIAGFVAAQMVSPASMMTAALFLIPIEGALRYGVRGAVIAVGAYSAVLIGLMLWISSAKDHPLTWSNLGVPLLAGAMVAAGAAAGAACHTRERLFLKGKIESADQRCGEFAERDDKRGSYLAAVSHELRTPVTSIIGFASTVRASADAIDASDRDHMLEILEEEARRLDAMLTDLLDIERIESGRAELQPEIADVSKMVRDVCDVAERRTGRTIEVNVPPKLEALIDVPKIERVVDNLLSNACKFSAPGDWVGVSVEDAGSHGVRIIVQDSGPGIPENERDCIFEAFNRGVANSGCAKGTGVGLVLVARFVSLHGGPVIVGERDGGGASFSVELPGA